MRAILIAPHADDETLFASFLAQRYAAHVVVVYDEGRENELAQATQWLGCTYQQLRMTKRVLAEPDDEEIEAWLNGLRDPATDEDWDLAIYPAEEVGGHEEHNAVARAASRAFGDVDSYRYTTYAPRGTRTFGTHEVFAEPPEQIARKLAAMSCYRSQIADPDTRPWFYNLLDMREWIA